ncbi:MAG: hypothetical protein EZS28_044540 [Streblomastix strix]|uniref:Uncharacterized protein n=1 Tax=Streblomastix strix TaxID=222440 RepID=A0A5J4TPW6_9EUKA|nr:MAG: hypothetical protein EZS28_044540 [Streblomastix strix]
MMALSYQKLDLNWGMRHCMSVEKLQQEQFEDEPEQDQNQLDLNNLPDNPENQGPSRLPQETRRSEANNCGIKISPKSSRRKKNGCRQHQLRFRTAHAGVGLEALIGGATTRDSSLEKLNLYITTTG